MEMIRGVLTIAFGLLFIFIDVRFFIYALGIYLIFDGTFDIYKVATGKRASKRKVLSPLGSAFISIVIGLICLVYHVLTIFLLLIIIVARVIISSVRAMIEAWRSRGPYAGVIWLYGGLLGLSGLVIFLFPAQALFFKLNFLLVFIIVYALCDGFYLLVRGLLLRFAPAVFTRSTSQAPESLLGIPDDLPPTTRRAIVFVRRMGANGLGHIAWTFEWHNGWFNAGRSRMQRGNLTPGRRRWGFGLCTRWILSRRCRNKAARTMSISSFMSRSRDRKKPGGRLSGRADSPTSPCVTIAMMWRMMYYERMALPSYSIRRKSTSPTTGIMPCLAAATRSLNTRLSRCGCVRCRSANWRPGKSS